MGVVTPTVSTCRIVRSCAGSPASPSVALVFEGQFTLDWAGLYAWRLVADDGAKLWIDGVEVIDLDGLHPPQSKAGSLDLQLFVAPPGQKERVFVRGDFAQQLITLPGRLGSRPGEEARQTEPGAVALRGRVVAERRGARRSEARSVRARRSAGDHQPLSRAGRSGARGIGCGGVTSPALRTGSEHRDGTGIFAAELQRAFRPEHGSIRNDGAHPTANQANDDRQDQRQLHACQRGSPELLGTDLPWPLRCTAWPWRAWSRRSLRRCSSRSGLSTSAADVHVTRSPWGNFCYGFINRRR